MKPYFLVLQNYIKLSLLKVTHRKLHFEKIQMISRNTKINIGKDSVVNIGANLVTDGRFVINVSNGASLSIGNHCYFNEQTMISVKSAVTIGDNVKFGPNVKIFDNNHVFDKENGVQGSHTSEPIFIGDNSWLASNVVVLKGATIGRNCVIGANCVVKGNIPDCSIVKTKNELEVRPME